MAALSAGCGGDSTSVADVEETVWETIRDGIDAQRLNATADRPDCVQDGDDGRFRCVASLRVMDPKDVRDPGQVYRVTIRVTCDGDRCLTEPVGAFPGG